MEGAHDLGGLDGFGPVVTADGDLTHHEPWELRAQAVALFGVRGGMRQWIERLDPATYLGSSYYVRWLRAAEDAVVAKGLVTAEALARWRDRLASDPDASPPRVGDHAGRQFVEKIMTEADRLPPAAAPRFGVGDRVVVRRWRDPSTHHRCPRYVRGVGGRVEAIYGDEPVPGREQDVAATYTVAFSSADLWGAGRERPFAVHVDLCEEYLAPADDGSGDD